MATERDWLHVAPEPRPDFEAENAELHRRLAAAAGLAELLCAWGHKAEARVTKLDADLDEIRHRGRPAEDEHIRTTMMVRYYELGGLERGRGLGAKQQVAKEFNRSVSTIERCIRDYKRKTVRVRKTS